MPPVVSLLFIPKQMKILSKCLMYRQKAAGVQMDGGLGKGIVRRIKPDFMRQAVAGVVQEDGDVYKRQGHSCPNL